MQQGETRIITAGAPWARRSFCFQCQHPISLTASSVPIGGGKAKGVCVWRPPCDGCGVGRTVAVSSSPQSWVPPRFCPNLLSEVINKGGDGLEETQIQLNKWCSYVAAFCFPSLH